MFISINTGTLIRFTDAYYQPQPPRGYGASVGIVFKKLRDLKSTDDLFLPAAEQFDGTGSYGNGSAMRVFPVALFYHKNQQEIENVRNIKILC